MRLIAQNALGVGKLLTANNVVVRCKYTYRSDSLISDNQDYDIVHAQSRVLPRYPDNVGVPCCGFNIQQCKSKSLRMGTYLVSSLNVNQIKLYQNYENCI